jgi:glycosyltransferase involved in cell wall biosynthesis
MPNSSPLAEDKDTSTEKFAAIIPAYNEEKTIRSVVEGTAKQMDRVVVINDGSTDDTQGQLACLSIELLSYKDNQGKAHALWRGFRHVVGPQSEGVITLDGDGQHLPEDIPRLIAAYAKYPDHLIIGTRTRDWSLFPPVRRWANQLANLGISLAAGCRVPDTQSGFRIYPASLLRRLQADSDRYNGFVFESEVIIEAVKLGFKIHSIPIAAVYGKDLRKSHFRPALDTIEIGKMIVGKIVSRLFKPAANRPN